MSTCNRLDLQTLGSQPVIMPKKSISPITVPEVLNFNQLFLELNWFIYNWPPVLPGHRNGQPSNSDSEAWCVWFVFWFCKFGNVAKALAAVEEFF